MVRDSVRSVSSFVRSFVHSFILRSSHFTSKECKWRSLVTKGKTLVMKGKIKTNRLGKAEPAVKNGKGWV